MKKITLSMVVLLGLMACTSSNDETVAVARDGQPANEVVEYVWHSKGANYSEESFALVVDKWNDLIDAQDYKMNGANILTPLVEVEGYDFILLGGLGSIFGISSLGPIILLGSSFSLLIYTLSNRTKREEIPLGSGLILGAIFFYLIQNIFI